MMHKWQCLACNFIYDEAEGWEDDGIPPGTRWEDVPDDWTCPECGIESSFQPYHCGVQFLPVYETHKVSLRLRVSDEDDSLIYEDEADLKAVREDLDQLITWWRESVEEKGFILG